MKTKKRYSFLLILMIFILLYGCVSAQTSELHVATATSLDAVTVDQIPSATLSPAFTKTSLPTKMPPPAPSGLPPTWTPLPTYPPDQARQAALDLYENSVCSLPCWWDITPGKTSWLEAWQFLGRFATNRSPWETLLLESEKRRGYMYYQVYLDFPRTPTEEYHLISNGPLFVINIKTFKVDYIDVDTGNVKDYTLSKILADYGKPLKIYVHGGETQIASGIELFLYYPQHGFISTQFTKVEPDVWNKPTFTACFQKVTTSLSLWPQEQNLDFYKRLEISGIDQGTLNLIKPIDKVSDSNVDKFYQLLTGNQAPCIEFKTELLETP